MHRQPFGEQLRNVVVYAPGEGPAFTPGDHVRILSRTPVAPHGIPFYLRGKRGRIESVIAPAEFGGKAGIAGQGREATHHYYRVAIPMTEIWRDYVGSPRDGLHLDIFETWLAEL